MRIINERLYEKKIAIGLAAVVLIALVGYVLLTNKKSAESIPVTNTGITYSSPELGLEFTYPAGPDGFVLQEISLVDLNSNELRNIVLWQTNDYASLDNPPIGGEGPPNITIQVFKNPEKQLPTAWAMESTAYSNINLKTSEPVEYVLNGAQAVRYPADGLYPSDNVIVAHGDNIFVFHGMYLTPDSVLRRGFEPLLQSVRFIPQPGQE